MIKMKANHAKILCSYCDTIVAKAKNQNKYFNFGDFMFGKDFVATKDFHKKKLEDGDFLLCKKCTVYEE